MNEDNFDNIGSRQGDDFAGLPPGETSVDLMKLILMPSEIQNKELSHITKDLAITTLDKREIYYLNKNLQLIHLLQYIEEQTGWNLRDLVTKIINADIKGYSQITRSKGGFERLAEISKHIKAWQSVTQEEKKKGWF